MPDLWAHLYFTESGGDPPTGSFGVTLMKKPRVRRIIRAGAASAKAMATRLRLRVNKALKNVPPEALTPDPHPDPEKEGEILQQAYDALPKIARDELNRRVYRDPGKPAVGDTVFVPFIGSAAEEAGCSRDVKTAFTLEEYDQLNKKVKKAGPKTCGMCFGWGTVGEKKCTKCKGKGAV